MAIDMDTSNQELPMATPLQEFMSHLKKDFGYVSLNEEYWLQKEQKNIEKTYDEGVEDGGFFGNGKDFFARTFKK
jgi:hypothetical protein